VAQRAALEDLAPEAAMVRGIGEQRELLRVFAQRLVTAVTIDAAERAVDVDDSAVAGGCDHDRVAAAVEDAAEAPLTLAQIIQHPLARRHVAPVGYHAKRAPD